MRATLALPLVVLLILAGSPALGQDDKLGPARWPQFRGPAAQGIGPAGLKLPAALAANRNLLWKTTVPPGHSSP
jgi:hypothetical protein